jgi:hypothetical protein
MELITFLQPVIEGLMGIYGGFAQAALVVIGLVGTMRIVFKPIMTAVEKIVSDTENKKDDEVLKKVKGHFLYRWFVFLMDFILSIKIDHVAKAVKKAPEPKPKE